jgi:hypothetical protein
VQADIRGARGTNREMREELMEWRGIREDGGGDGVALGGSPPEQQGAPALAVRVVVGVSLDAAGGDVDLLVVAPPPALLMRKSIEDARVGSSRVSVETRVNCWCGWRAGRTIVPCLSRKKAREEDGKPLELELEQALS